MDPAAYVLRDFAAPQREELGFLLGRAADAVETLLASGLAAAQNAFHPDISPPTGQPGEASR
jgi:PTH1 family peptidyl-tRNA hydrolase